MVDTARAEALVQAMEHDATFQSEVKAAHSVAAKHDVLDAHGFADVSLEEMRAYVESKGGKLNVPQAGHELSDAELSAVAGGLTEGETGLIIMGGTMAVSAASAAAA